MGDRLWEIRTDLPTKRAARVLLRLYREHLVVLHGLVSTKTSLLTCKSGVSRLVVSEKPLELLGHHLPHGVDVRSIEVPRQVELIEDVREPPCAARTSTGGPPFRTLG